VKTLTREQAEALAAFLAAFDELTGAWVHVEKSMREDWGIEDPEAAIESAREALQS
jgi:hypothetical protein